MNARVLIYTDWGPEDMTVLKFLEWQGVELTIEHLFGCVNQRGTKRPVILLKDEPPLHGFQELYKTFEAKGYFRC